MKNQEAERLRMFMEKENISSEELQNLTKKLQPTISKYLNGHLRIPAAVVKMLHFKYHLNFNWFYLGTGRMKVNVLDKRDLVTDITEMKADILLVTTKLQRAEETIAKLVQDLYAFRNEMHTQQGHTS
jgi:transcriptional regulator with XRE-family HTH domain